MHRNRIGVAIVGLAGVGVVARRRAARLAGDDLLHPGDGRLPPIDHRDAASDSREPRRFGRPPASWSRDELYREAQRLDIPGRSRMRKSELAEAVAEASAATAA